MVRSLEAAVPRHLPQTAQCAEYLAMTIGFDYVRRAATFTGDCLGVVKAMGGGVRRALVATAKYAGLVLHTHRNPEQRRMVQEVRWTKAHRTASGSEGRQDARDIRANTLADELAKNAVNLHPKMGIEMESQIEFWTKRAPLVAKAVAAALRTFPPAPKGMGRPPEAGHRRPGQSP